ncbi:MAG: hypothetical protein GXO17_05470 [Thermodesulfobacteria bacterium]|nr:hypothetical protein [Thermodesulfobacteriota bacterium]
MAAVYTFSPRSSSSSNKRVGLSLNLFHVLALVVVGFLAILLLAGGVLLTKEYLRVRHLRQEVGLLQAQTKDLSAEYERLTAKDVVFRKARVLGLHLPKKEQVVRVR